MRLRRLAFFINLPLTNLHGLFVDDTREVLPPAVANSRVSRVHVRSKKITMVESCVTILHGITSRLFWRIKKD